MREATDADATEIAASADEKCRRYQTARRFS